MNVKTTLAYTKHTFLSERKRGAIQQSSSHFNHQTFYHNPYSDGYEILLRLVKLESIRDQMIRTLQFRKEGAREMDSEWGGIGIPLGGMYEVLCP